MLMQMRGRLYTSCPAQYNHYGEKVQKKGSKYLREWNPNKSKIAAAIKKGFNLNLENNSSVLYVGCSTGTTLSHIADIVTKGKIIANDISAESMLSLIPLLRIKTNISPVLDDYKKLVDLDVIKGNYDFVFQDVSQKDQVDVFIDIVKEFLSSSGQGAISLKTRSIDSTKTPKQVLNQSIEKIKRSGLRIINTYDLEPFEKEHYFLEVKK